MNEILNRTVDEITGLEFDCSCGRRHQVGIDKIVIGAELADEAGKTAAYFGRSGIFFIADEHTYKAFGFAVERQLRREGFSINSHVFKGQEPLIPDEAALGRLLAELEAGTGLIIAVGAGTINDLAQMLSCKVKIPYVIVCTAPSTDGYASPVCTLIVGEDKKTYPAVYPRAVIADTSVLKNAPADMLRAGFGNVVGKLPCLADWRLSHELTGEYYCPTTEKLMLSAVDKCVQSTPGVPKRSEEAVENITQALILSGVAIGLAGTSRPASGAEHHLAHYWETHAPAHSQKHALHGSAVGVGAVISSRIYELMADRVPPHCRPQESAYIIGLLRGAGACHSPKELGIPRALFYESVLHAKEAQDRFTVLSLAASYGLLEQFAGILTQEFYG